MAHRLTGYGADEYVTIIEQHRHINGRVGKVETIDIGEWSDDHPLNQRGTDLDKYFQEHK